MPDNEVRHLSVNDPAPAPLTDPGKLRVYNMRYCPYAERTLLALNSKGIEYEIVNINLSNKPKWFLELSPLGKVPVVEFGPIEFGHATKDNQPRRIFESDVTVELVDKLFPGDAPLLPQDPLLEAEGKCFRALFDAKFMPHFFSCFKAAGPGQPALTNEDRKQALKDALEALRALEPQFLGKPFVLPGDHPSFVDVLIFPFVERLETVAEALEVDKKAASLESMPKWQAWMKAMQQTETVKKTARSHKELAEFSKKVIAKNDDRYD